MRPCPPAAPGEIIVCARLEDGGARYRLPLNERGADLVAVPIAGEMPRASAVPVQAGSCGIVGGQPYGCTGGLPLVGAAMMIGRIARALIDPDADHEPPPSLPERFAGAGGH